MRRMNLAAVAATFAFVYVLEIAGPAHAQVTAFEGAR